MLVVLDKDKNNSFAEVIVNTQQIRYVIDVGNNKYKVSFDKERWVEISESQLVALEKAIREENIINKRLSEAKIKYLEKEGHSKDIQL